MMLLTVVLSGCAEELDTAYGKSSGMTGGESVNGTAVWTQMFKQAGHKVSQWHWLSPKLRNEADVIVWFPDDFAPPSEDVRQWFEEWLTDGIDRTLIYVGRDFDAAPLYWDKIRDPTAAAAEVAEVNRRLAEARRSFRSARGGIPTLPEEQDCEWFVVSDQIDVVEVQDLTGQQDWLVGVDGSKAEIRLNGRIKPAPAADVLLASEAGPLVSRIQVGESQIIIVANGSFLLNLPLVNHEHRRLAARMIDEVGSNQRIFFLESSSGGPKIIDEDPSAQLPQGIEIFGIAPGAMWHLVTLGILFCLCRIPVFGLPRQLDDAHESDFGKHVEALGELLQRTKNRTFALTRLIHYQQTSRGEAPRRAGAGDAPPMTTRPKKNSASESTGPDNSPP